MTLRYPGETKELGMILRRRFMVALILAAALAAAALTGGACSDPVETERVVFMAGFKPQANLPFAAAYVAQEKGYFADQDLEVEILHASTGEHLKLLMAGDVDFTTASAASVLKSKVGPGPSHLRHRTVRPGQPAGVHRPEGQRHRVARGLGGQDLRLQDLAAP